MNPWCTPIRHRALLLPLRTSASCSKKYPTSIYLFKVCNGNIKKIREICSYLTIKTLQLLHWHRSSVFTVRFKHTSLTFLAIPLLTWTNKHCLGRDWNGNMQLVNEDAAFILIPYLLHLRIGNILSNWNSTLLSFFAVNCPLSGTRTFSIYLKILEGFYKRQL